MGGLGIIGKVVINFPIATCFWGGCTTLGKMTMKEQQCISKSWMKENLQVAVFQWTCHICTWLESHNKLKTLPVCFSTSDTQFLRRLRCSTYQTLWTSFPCCFKLLYIYKRWLHCKVWCTFILKCWWTNDIDLPHTWSSLQTRDSATRLKERPEVLDSS